MKKVYVILITICIILVLYIGVDQSIRSSKPYSSVTTEEMLEKVISTDNYVIVDARTEVEYEQGHVVGAVNIPYDNMDEDICTYFGLDGKDVIVYSGDEKESNLACAKLVKLGYGGLDIGAYDAITLEKEKGSYD